MIVAFWSPMHGKGTTSNCLGISCIAALQDRQRFYIMQNHPRMNRLYESFAGEIGVDIDTGIDALVRILKTGQWKRKSFENTCTTYLSGRLNVLSGTQRKTAETIEYLKIIEFANTLFDQVIIDCNSGMINKSTREILQRSEKIVVSITQEIEVLQETVMAMNEEYFKKAVFLVTEYDKESRNNIKNIVRKFPKLKGCPIIAIPYNSTFFDAKNENRVLEFFNQNFDSSKKDKNYMLIDALKNGVEEIFQEV